MSLAGAACSSVEEIDGRDAQVSDGPTARLARVHVILQSEPDPIAVEPQLDISARFVAFRGLDEEFVRGRVGLGQLPYERLEPGTCVVSEALDGVDVRERSDGPERELHLVDAGNLRVSFGDIQTDVPLVLLPDLLPYMTGVEYEQVTDALPTVFVYDDVHELSVEIEGSGDDEIPATTLTTRMPPRLDLKSNFSLDPSVIELRWRGAPRSDLPMILRIGAYVGSEPVGAEVTCAVVDRGSYRLDLRELRGLGLGVAGEGLHIRASRYEPMTFDAGEFAGGEFIVEIRDGLFTVLR
ncbi:MAG: hypothetical protein KC486_18510 [Myxococcales bacterium]|nr:hypothetical protein [Myxococcales bacterium]